MVSFKVFPYHSVGMITSTRTIFEPSNSLPGLYVFNDDATASLILFHFKFQYAPKSDRVLSANIYSAPFETGSAYK